MKTKTKKNEIKNPRQFCRTTARKGMEEMMKIITVDKRVYESYGYAGDRATATADAEADRRGGGYRGLLYVGRNLQPATCYVPPCWDGDGNCIDGGSDPEESCEHLFSSA